MILRYLVALPCYNNSETVEQVILDTLAETIFPLLLIDDGSDIPVRETLSNPQVLEAIESGRLSFFRHQENNGKGAALQTAFKWALKNNFTHVITVDTDGQHLAKEIPKVLAKSRECPWSLVIGSRKWQGAVPGSSKFGRKFSNFWVKFETGYKALDSQSGFRIYPLFHIQNFSFYTTKYDFEIEVLIRLLWTKVDVQEVDIVVHYAAPGVRVTHFNKFWDNVRISLLNCVLVTVSLLRGHMEPARSGVAIGAGVMVGVSPFFGIHTFMAAAVALLFRLNFLLVFIGTQIGLPFFAPFIAIASIRIGRRILARHGGPGSHLQMPHNLNQALHMSGRFFTEWLVGSIVLGLVLGLVLGGLYYLFQKAYSSEKKAGWTGKTRGGVLGNGFLKLMLKNFGLRTGYFFLYFIVPYFYIFAPRARSSLSTYWRGIDPQGSWFDRQRNIIAHFFTFGQVLMDRVYQSYHEKLVFEVSREGPIYIDEVIESARGWVFVGAHVGGWDISSLFFKKDPRSARLGMVHYQAEGLTFDKVLERDSEASKVDSIQSSAGEGSLITVKNYLTENQHVGFLADRAMGSQIELIPFLGKLAPFETRPFRVAAACKAPLIFTYNFKSDERHYAFLTSNHSELTYNSSEDKQLQVYKWTETFVQDLEKQIRRYPHQWFNFYPFWSSLPMQIQAGSSGRSDNCLVEELK